MVAYGAGTQHEVEDTENKSVHSFIRVPSSVSAGWCVIFLQLCLSLKAFKQNIYQQRGLRLCVVIKSMMKMFRKETTGTSDFPEKLKNV